MRAALSTRYPKQPRRGDTIMTGRYGECTVTEVHERGLRLQVTDRLGRSWTVERAAAGCWFRTGLAAA